MIVASENGDKEALISALLHKFNLRKFTVPASRPPWEAMDAPGWAGIFVIPGLKDFPPKALEVLSVEVHSAALQQTFFSHRAFRISAAAAAATASKAAATTAATTEAAILAATNAATAAATAAAAAAVVMPASTVAATHAAVYVATDSGTTQENTPKQPPAAPDWQKEWTGWENFLGASGSSNHSNSDDTVTDASGDNNEHKRCHRSAKY